MTQFGRALDGFDDFRYTDELAGDSSLALVFTASLRGEPLEGLDLFRLDEARRVTGVTVMIRPLSVLASLAEARSRPAAGFRDQ